MPFKNNFVIDSSYFLQGKKFVELITVPLSFIASKKVTIR